MKTQLSIIENKLNDLHSLIDQYTKDRVIYKVMSTTLTEIKQMVDELKRKAVILLLLLPMFGMAQYGHTGKDLYDTREVTSKEMKPKYDTIPVIMLVCDTAIYEFGVVRTKGEYVQHYEPNYSATWKNGYEVSEKYWPYHPNYMVFNEQQSVRHIKYLDSDKKPLGNNIIVWDTKNRSK
jgi:hypothetical protein